MDKKLKVGVIGCGGIANQKHFPALKNNSDKAEIVALARKIDTFETSILPYEDCCTVFTPRHPKLKPTVAECEEIEKALDIEALVEEAVKNIERIRLA